MRELALVLPVQVAAVVWLTWPLAAHLRTHLPDTGFSCRFDLLQMIWALAYQSHTLTTAPWRLPEANIYYPAHHALFYGDAGFGALPYFMPPYLLTADPALASNLAFLASITLTAAALHFVVRRWTASHLAGLVAAWAFLTTRWVLWIWPAETLSYAVLQYFPVIVYLAASPVARRGRTSLLVLLVVLQGLVTIYFAVPVLAGLGLVGIARTIRPTSRRAGVRLLVAVLVALLPLLLANVGYLVVRRENPAIATQTQWGWDRPNLELPWGLLRPDAATDVSFVALALIAAGAVSFLLRGTPERRGRLGRAWLHGALWTVIGVVLSLTPVVLWFGRPVALGPLAVSTWFPFLRRVDRLAVAALMGLCILTGLGFAECARRLQRGGAFGVWAPRVLAVLVIAAFYAQYAYDLGSPAFLGGVRLPSSYPLAAVTPTSPLLTVLRRPGGPLLEVPAISMSGRSLDPAANARAMYRSTFHWRRILNGYGGYWPAEFRERMMVTRSLPDPAAVAYLRRETELELVLVHAGEFGRLDRELCETMGLPSAYCPPGLGSAERATWLDLAATGGRPDLRLVARDGDDLLFDASAGVK